MTTSTSRDLAQAVTMYVAMTARAISGWVRAFAAVLTAGFLAAVCAINVSAHGALGLVPPLSGGALLVLLHTYRHSLRTADVEAERVERERRRQAEHTAQALADAERATAEARAEAERLRVEREARPERPTPRPRPRPAGTAAPAPTSDTARLREHIDAEVAAGRPVPSGAAMAAAFGVKPDLARRVRSDWRKDHPDHLDPVHAV